MTAADGLSGRLARAKVNLTLHIRGRRADGYHLLESLVVFPELGDRLEVEPADALSLELSGPFAPGLSADDGNLVLKAAHQLQQETGTTAGAAFRLEKNLPVASGIGGGSSDAAAALALLSSLWQVEIPPGLALELGADVPVCCEAPTAQIMRGIGEILEPAPPLPQGHIVLVNPGFGVETGAVFRAIDHGTLTEPSPVPADGFSDFRCLATWLATQRNDLQAAAICICPPIADVLEALDEAPLARMSGSGATCFALFERAEDASALAARLRRETDWWAADAPVAGGLPRPGQA